VSSKLLGINIFYCVTKSVILGGQEKNLVIFPASHFGRGNGSVLLDDVNCLGHENDLSSCQHGGWESSTCSHDNDIGIDCGIVYSQN
jgi:hypothetical protein